MLWFFGKKKAEDKELVVLFELNSRDVTEKETRKHLKKSLPHITKKEVGLVINHLRRCGHITLRVSRKEWERLQSKPALFASNARDDVSDRPSDDCCPDVCDHGCAMGYLDSRFFGKTNLGIINKSGEVTPFIHQEGDN
jgi:hypothetical protein